uniref:Uncharacterized protein n=1 Tax=Glossina austeni TaxID=7395 RepID=A0A1A9UWM2_GLOAU
MTKKYEIMGKLWLRNKVETLEEELRKNPLSFVMTPFLVINAKALTEYNAILKNLLKSKKFIVLIPNTDHQDCFYYLNCGRSAEIDKISVREQFKETIQAMQALGVDPRQVCSENIKNVFVLSVNTASKPLILPHQVYRRDQETSPWTLLDYALTAN